MAEPKKKRPAGDIRLLEQDIAPESQPLTEEGKQLVLRAYELFEDFRQKLVDDHSEMQDARLTYELRQAERAMHAPQSSTLLSCIDNVVADQLDNMPEAKMLPEREDTANAAEEIADIVAYILYHADWPKRYRHIVEDAVVTGTGIAQVFWDDDLEDGEGMVNVSSIHPEDFYPDPAYEDIQDGRGIFVATRVTVAWVMEHYPEAGPYVEPDQSTVTNEYVDPRYQNELGDASTILLEFWYRKYDAKKRKYRVHKAILAGHALLYSTELSFGGPSKDEYRQGVYAHGQYPFVMYKYRDVFRKPFGTGMVHDYREQQDAIDRYLKYIDDNARASAKPKTYVRKSAGINTEDIADYSKDYVEFEGSDIRAVMQTVQADPLNGQVYQIMNYLVDTMKQDCGQNQFTRGEGGLGVTAASAIQALQEAGSKITRMRTESFKESFKMMVEQIIWVMSEYLTADRKFMIVGGWDSTGNMQQRLIQLLAPPMEGDELKKPAYAVQVQVQKRNPLQIQVDNEFLSQCAQICAQAGSPLPPEAVIGLMEGYRTKSSVLKVVQQNSIVQQQIQQLTVQVEQLTQELETKNKIIENDSKVMGTPSIMQRLQEQGMGQQPNYEGLTDIEGNVTEDNAPPRSI